MHECQLYLNDWREGSSQTLKQHFGITNQELQGLGILLASYTLDDCQGDYGMEDTRQAPFEARFKGIHPFYIRIDDERLPEMFGASNYMVTAEVGKPLDKVLGRLPG